MSTTSEIVKHMLTHRCNRGCSYCITKFVITDEVTDEGLVREAYEEQRLNGYHKLMITGGEPTMARQYESRVRFAREHWPEQFITTQAPHVLTSEFHDEYFNAITFSVHGRKLHDSIVVDIDIPVYASVIHFQANQGLADDLASRGFSGLTINAEQRNGPEDLSKILPNIVAPKGYPNFSIKLNKIGKCMDDIIILPDLTVVNNYRPYLKGTQ